jgi:hypothetical protein
MQTEEQTYVRFLALKNTSVFQSRLLFNYVEVYCWIDFKDSYKIHSYRSLSLVN